MIKKFVTSKCDPCDSVTPHRIVGPNIADPDFFLDVECEYCGIGDQVLLVSDSQLKWLLGNG